MAYKKSNPNGQATMANSEPVVLASDHSDVKITLDSEAVVLGAGSAAIGKLAANDGVDIGNVDVASSALPTGASTSAKQDTIIGHLDGVEGLLTTIDADTSTLAGAVAGTEVQVDIVSSALPSGAATAAKQPALGTAGAASADVITVQGIASMTALKVDGSAVTQPVSGTVTANLAAGTNNIGDVDILSIAAGDNNIGNVDVVTVPADPFGANADAAATAGSTGSMQAKLRLVTSQLDSIKTAVETLDNVVAGSEAQVDIVGALPAGTNAIGKLAANSGVDIGDVDVTSMPGTGVEDAAETVGGTLLMAGTVRRDTAASSAGTTGDNATLNTDASGRLWTTDTVIEDVAHSAGEAIVGNGVRRIDTAATSAGSSGDWATMDASAEGALWVTTTPTTTSGCSIFRSIDLDETEEDIKTSAGNLYGYYFFNAAATTHYLKFYNATAANVTVGTTTPVLTFPLPAGAAGHISFGFPVSFGTAISAAVTTGLADNDTGAPAANAVILNAFYK